MHTELYSLPQEWDDAIGHWVEWMTTGGASAETLRVRRGILRSVVKRIGSHQPDQVSTEDLVTMCSRQKWSIDHRRNVRTTLVVFYDWALHAGICTDNPARRMPKVRAAAPRPRPAPDKVWLDLLMAADPRERMMARLAGEAGLRRAEVAKVQRDDVISDLYGYSLVVQGKGGKQRTVPLTDSLANAILEYRRTPGYLFPGQIDGHMSPNHCGKLLSRLMPEGWSAHKLRHRYASRGFAATGDLLAVQTALGHSSVATTQRYVQVSTQSVRAVSEAAA